VFRSGFEIHAWQVGECISYRLGSGQSTIFRVIGHHSDSGGTSPICELLDWIGDKVPSEQQLRALRIRASVTQPARTQFLICAASTSEYPAARIQSLDVKLKPFQEPGSFTVILWRWLDKFLLENFQLS